MTEFKLVISDPENGEAYQTTVSGRDANALLNKKLGEEINGDSVGITGYQFKVLGGTDSDGFPMKAGVEGPQRRKVLLSGGPGFNPKRDGQRKKKSVMGNVVTESITQINLRVTEKGETELQELL